MTEGEIPAAIPDWLQARGMREGVIVRTLAETHLLVDNISSSLNKTLPAIAGLDEKIPGRQMPPDEWLVKLASIEWPLGKEVDKAEEAKVFRFLTTARDALTQHAFPATGQSIAFTLMVVGDKTGERDATGDAASQKDVTESPEAGGQGRFHLPIKYDIFAIVKKWRLKKSTPRKSNMTQNRLSTIAFGHLENRKRFAYWVLFRIVPALMAITLFLTTAFSYDAYYGSAISAQYAALVSASEAQASQIAQDEDSSRKGGEKNPPGDTGSDAGAQKTA